MQNYLEGHHIIPMFLSDSFNFNLDVEANIIPLCPNCHRKIHLATKEIKKQLIQDFYSKVDLTQLGISEIDIVNIYTND